MLIYNVTIKPDWSIHDDWLQWMKDEHIPEMLATKYFHKSQMVRLLEVNDEDGPTYAVQYYAETKNHFAEFMALAFQGLREKSIAKWGTKLVVFDTIMEVVN